MDANGDPTIAVVLPGGGARGAYEVGALSELLPVLEARGERVSVWCGTSVGAINATAFASRAHLGAIEQVEQARLLWLSMRKRDVIDPIVGIGGLRTAARAIGGVLGCPAPGSSRCSTRGRCSTASPAGSTGTGSRPTSRPSGSNAA